MERERASPLTARGGASRSPLTPYRKLNVGFVPPAPRTPRSATPQVSLQTQLEALRKKRDDLDREIRKLDAEGFTVEELEEHIHQLHEYNDIKDVGQMLLGKLAVIRGVTTRELYNEFGLEVDD
uniref:DNA repair protein SWI5 homolog n=1 Tax=Callorhinchus milii TaxID=7868 RepID=V9LHQ8_CALMI